MTAPASVVTGRREVLRRAAEALKPSYGERAAPTIVPVERPRPYPLRQLLEHPEMLIAPPALIPNLAYPSRATLVAGREKSGKSTLIGQAVAAASRGGEFLGDKLQPLRTLWYGIDEDIADTARRFAAFDADPDMIEIQPERPTSAQMAQEAAGFDVVVIDVLPELWSGLINSSRSADDVLPFLRPYINVARDLDMALILLHHTGKNGVEYRDSSAIGGVVDVVLTLRQRGIKSEAEGAEWDAGAADDGRRVLDGKGRGGINVKMRLAFDGSRYSLGSAPMPLRSRILSELSKAEASGSTLAACLKVQKETVLAEIRDLRSEGLILTRGSGPKSVFELSASGHSCLSVPDEKPHTQTREPIALDEVDV